MDDDPMVSLRSVLGTQDQRSWRRHLDGRAPRLVLAVLVIAAGIVIGAGFGPGAPPTDEAEPDRSSPRDAVAAAGPPSSAPASTSSTVAVRLWPPTALHVEGRHVTNDGGRWEVGADGDLVVVGDWDCDHLPTPAVLRPSTGQIAVFDRWAGVDPEPARSVATLTGVSDVQPTERCGELLVRGPAGIERRIDTRPAAT
jgi:hypothetical protein